MSLAFTTNIAGREDLVTILHDMLSAMPGPISFHIRDGRKLFHEVLPAEFKSACESVGKCSLIYVMEGTRGRFEPIAAFVANESLRSARVQHLIDGRADAGEHKIPRQTAEYLHLYVSSLFETFRWLDVVSVPARVESMDGMFGLSVEREGDDCCHVRLKDAKHRPYSSRPLRNR